jgi:hypothetical protein
VCGNGHVDPGEECDGTDFGGVTCANYGLGPPGMLMCTPLCYIVASGCSKLENCTNEVDDNNDGLIDCRDPECSGKPGCADSCTPPYPISVGDTPSADTTSRPNVHRASCSSATSGNEQIFQLTAPSTGELSVELFYVSANFSVSVRTSCDDDASEIGCTNQQVNDRITLLFPVTMGQTYFLMIDGMTPADAGPFTLILNAVTPETNCADFLDNDFDGYVDCDDPTACQSLPACVPGATPTGQACSANTDCTANHNDPICLQLFQFPNGYCSEFCDTTLQDCSPGNVCYAGLNLSVHGVCLHTCAADSDCRIADGYGCVDKGLAGKVCTIAPETACNDYLDNDHDLLTDCQDPTLCQTLPACTPGTQAIGQPCTQHSDCVASPGVNDPFCLDETHEFNPNGYCSHFCDPNVPSDCGPGALCVPNGPFSANICMVTCTSDAQCRTAEGYACLNMGFAEMVCAY